MFKTIINLWNAVFGDPDEVDYGDSWWLKWINRIFITTIILFAVAICSPLILIALFCTTCFLSFYSVIALLMFTSRSLKSRWKFFTKGIRDSRSYMIDSIIHVFLWTFWCCVLGRVFGGCWPVGFGVAILGFLIGSAIEFVYYVAEELSIPIVGDTATFFGAGQKTTPNDHYWFGMDASSNSYDAPKNDYKPKVPWGWSGYQPDEGPKEDSLYAKGI